MAGATISRIRIAGIVAGVPEPVVENRSLEHLGSPAELDKVVRATGIERRRVVPPGQTTSDLCEGAARRLMADLTWRPEDIRLVVFVSQTPDYRLPSTACLMQQRLGLPSTVAAFDVPLGCSGYVYGLWIASGLLNTLGGGRALLLVGDTSTCLTAPDDKSVAFLFGDAGTATALESSTAGTMSFDMGTDGGGANHLIIPGGMHRQPLIGDMIKTDKMRGPLNLFMDGPQVFNFTLREVPELVNRVLAGAAMERGAVDRFIFHQANRYILDYLARRMGLPADRVVLALRDFGNTSSASIPLAIAADRAARSPVEPETLLLAGFGVGWSWAAAVLVLEAACRTAIVDVPLPA